MNIQLSLEKKINKFGQKAKILQKNENAHEMRKKKTLFMSGRVSYFISQKINSSEISLRTMKFLKFPQKLSRTQATNRKYANFQKLTPEILKITFFIKFRNSHLIYDGRAWI